MVQKFKTPDHWYPADLQKRARVDEYLSWQHINIRAKGSKLFLSKVKPLYIKNEVLRAVREMGCLSAGPFSANAQTK